MTFPKRNYLGKDNCEKEQSEKGHFGKGNSEKGQIMNRTILKKKTSGKLHF